MELSEIREIVKNSKNHKDRALLETIMQTGHTEEEAVEIIALWYNEMFSSVNAIKSNLSAPGKKSDIEELSKKIFSELEGQEIDHIDTLEKIINRYHLYNHYRKKIENKYKETKNWGAVFSNFVYADEPVANEAFIDYLEEIYNTKIKDVKQLQELTGIKTLNRYYTAKGEQISYEEAEKLDEKGGKPLMEESKDEAIKQLQETLLASRYSKYARALETVIKTGGTYKDLLAIDPKDYDLPENWGESRGCLATGKQNAILWAIVMELLDSGILGLLSHPSPREIAKELEAPYSVIMEAYKLKRGVN